MASFLTDAGMSGLTSGGTIVFASDTLKVRLVASSSTPAKGDTDLGTNYTGIGTDYTLAAKQKSTDGTNHRINFDNTTDPSWTSVASGSTIGWIVVYKFVTNDAGSTPIAVIDVTDTPTNGSNIGWTIASTGMWYLAS